MNDCIIVLKTQINFNRATTCSPLELDENEQTPQAKKSIVRIRDPVTSNVKTVYLTEAKKKELGARLEQDKNKVHSFVRHKSRVSVDLQHSNIMNEYYKQENIKTIDNSDDFKKLLANNQNKSLTDGEENFFNQDDAQQTLELINPSDETVSKDETTENQLEESGSNLAKSN